MLAENTENKARVAPLIGIFLILLSLATYTFFLRPLRSYVDQANESLVSKSQEVEDLRANIDDLKNAQAQLGLSTEVERQEILRKIPVGMQQDEVIRDLIDIADENDIVLNSLSFGQGGSTKEGISALRVNSSFEGSFSDLIAFLEGIESNSRLLNVEAISVQLSSLEVAGLRKANFSLSMEAFFQG